MQPILYSSFTLSGNSYHYNIVGVLTHCTKCEVHEIRNGAYTLSLETTVNEESADRILAQNVIAAKPNPTDPIQFFEIQKTTRSLDGIIKVEAKHIKHLCFQICSDGGLDFSDSIYTYTGTPQQVWNKLVSDFITGGSVPFTFSSNISSTRAFYLGMNTAEMLGNILGGKEGSFTDMWAGGEFYWNNFAIEFKSQRGRNSGFRLRYGSNISSAIQSESCESMYSHVLPYGKVTGESQKTINFFAPRFEITGHQCQSDKTFMLDCTSLLDAYVADDRHGTNYGEIRAAMTAYAQQYAQNNGLGQLNISIKVDVRAALDEMTEIGLCDTVDVILDNFGTTATAKIVDVTYDVLLERWTKIVVGAPTVTVADLILNKRRYNIQ
ncbi:MAG: phage tail protein [Ruminococcus sp.]|nr:phage tail protein [Ruminococcus sp.]